MSTRWIDPDFADRPKPAAAARPPRFLGMRPAFAAVATPLLITAVLAAIAPDPEGPLSASPRPAPAPAPARVWMLSGPAIRTRAPRLASVDPRMILAARAGVDEAMIHRARPDLDPRMIVPAPSDEPAQGIVPSR